MDALVAMKAKTNINIFFFQLIWSLFDIFDICEPCFGAKQVALQEIRILSMLVASSYVFLIIFQFLQHLGVLDNFSSTCWSPSHIDYVIIGTWHCDVIFPLHVDHIPSESKVRIERLVCWFTLRTCQWTIGRLGFSTISFQCFNSSPEKNTSMLW